MSLFWLLMLNSELIDTALILNPGVQSRVRFPGVVPSNLSKMSCLVYVPTSNLCAVLKQFKSMAIIGLKPSSLNTPLVLYKNFLRDSIY